VLPVDIAQVEPERKLVQRHRGRPAYRLAASRVPQTT
jgi:hypothetical protein